MHLTTTRKQYTQIAPQLLGRNEMETISGDKGYDDQRLRDMLRRKGVRSLIKHREFKQYDKAANARMDKKLYSQRNMAETANSVIKRRYGDRVRSRKWHHQFREIIVKCIVYNIERAIKSLVLKIQVICKKVFYKASDR